jgi:trans-aconitate methyltransferase
MSTGTWSTPRRSFTALPEVTGLLCLDLGCGEGHNTRLLTDCGARVVGLDIADLFIAAAAERARGILAGRTAVVRSLAWLLSRTYPACYPLCAIGCHWL